MDKICGKFYFVCTPIGNLSDMSERQINTLNECDIIYCEDTRHSMVLLNHFDIKKPLKSYHKFNYNKAIPQIISQLKNGEDICLITDAGMPAISDPGNEIVEHLKENNIEYTVISGTSAFLNAFVMSGFSSPFTFVGFLPNTNKECKNLLEDLRNYRSCLIFYSAPHNINQDLKTLSEYFFDRNVCVCNELTKLYEKKYFGTLNNLQIENPRGEYVIVLDSDKIQTDDFCDMDTMSHYKYYLDLNYSKNDAIKQVAKDKKVAKSIIYKEIVDNK